MVCPQTLRVLVKSGPDTRVQFSIYLNEIQKGLEYICGVFISIITISYTLAHMEISKSLLCSVAECNKELWILWELEFAQLNDPCLVIHSTLVKEDEQDHSEVLGVVSCW